MGRNKYNEENSAMANSKTVGRKNRRKGKKVLIRRGIAFLAILLICSSVVLGAMFGFIDNSTDLIAMEYSLDLSSVVYAENRDGEIVEIDRIYAEQNRVWSDLADIPKDLKEAFIAIEDERFLTHHGVDWKRTFGAVLGWAFDPDSAYGGSTITQQLIKNVTGDKKRSPIRKVQEIIRALNLERKMSKDEIIEMYMNTIYLGQGCHGVQTAANKYYSKDVSELNLAECASIAGITQYPSKYDPFLNYEAHKEKQERVLAKMLERGFITQKEHDDAAAEELNLHEGSAKNVSSGIQSYFIDQVITDVLNDLMDKYDITESEATKKIFKGGLKIYSTADTSVQKAMEDVFENYSNTEYKESQYQSAMVVIDPKNGHIKGIVGGRGKKTGNRILNRASSSLRQPGSSIKPIAVYAPAIEEKIISPATILKDSPLTVGSWSPKNSDGTFMGNITTRVALEKSRNIPAIRVLQELTVEKSYDFLTQKLGISTLVDSEKKEDGKIVSDKVLSLALGGVTKGISPLEMTAAYVPFANGGKYYEPVTYTKVVDPKGKIILQNEQLPIQAMSDQTAYIMSNMLSGVMTYGTGTGARLASGQWAGGKTGTSDYDKDKWFVGYTPYYVGGVWSGYDLSTKYGGISGNPSISLWKRVMDKIHTGLSYKTITQPDGLSVRTVCQASGNLATELCTNTRVDYYRSGAMPYSYCSSHEEENEEATDENGNVLENPEGDGENTDSGGENTETAGDTNPPPPPAPDDTVTWWTGE